MDQYLIIRYWSIYKLSSSFIVVHVELEECTFSGGFTLVHLSLSTFIQHWNAMYLYCNKPQTNNLATLNLSQVLK